MKQTIAVDIDDVLAVNARSFIDFSNKQWGTHLSVDDYDERWGVMWQIDEDEVNSRSEEWHASGQIGRNEHFTEAPAVLRQLAKNYRLVIVTSRRSIIKDETLKWVDTYFGDIFEEIRFAGFFDNGFGHHFTKAEIVQELGASYLIDDQLKHCVAAAEAGINSLLFGDYKWNQTTESLPEKVARVSDWQAVAKYFSQKSGDV
jgi:uncharacterized HAD superfamily protein